MAHSLRRLQLVLPYPLCRLEIHLDHGQEIDHRTGLVHGDAWEGPCALFVADLNWMEVESRRHRDTDADSIEAVFVLQSHRIAICATKLLD